MICSLKRQPEVVRTVLSSLTQRSADNHSALYDKMGACGANAKQVPAGRLVPGALALLASKPRTVPWQPPHKPLPEFLLQLQVGKRFGEYRILRQVHPGSLRNFDDFFGKSPCPFATNIGART